MFLIDKVPEFCPVCGVSFRSGWDRVWDGERIQFFFAGSEHTCKSCGEVFGYRAFEKERENLPSADDK